MHEFEYRQILALFHDLQHSEVIPEKFNRTPKKNVHIITEMYLLLSSNALGILLLKALKEQSKNSIPNRSRLFFTEELTRDMIRDTMIRFLISQKSIVNGPDQHIEKCDAHYRKVMEWIFKRLGYSSSDGPILAAINTFYTEKESKNKRDGLNLEGELVGQW